MPAAHRWPSPLYAVVSALLLGIVALLSWAAWSGGGSPGYGFVKDLFVPLIGPLVGIFVPAVLFYVLPITQNHTKAALELFAMFNAQDMCDARDKSWAYLVTGGRGRPEERERRLQRFLRYLSVDVEETECGPEIHEIFQKASKVLDFWAVVNGMLERRAVDRDLIHDALVYYYRIWREEVMEPLRSRPFPPGQHAAFRPPWYDRLAALDAICGR